MGIGLARTSLACAQCTSPGANFLAAFLAVFPVPYWDPFLNGLPQSRFLPERSSAAGVERRSCLFFFEQADPATGMVKDRARHTGPDAHTISSIAATGFGLSALCIAHANKFLRPEDALNRVRTTLDFLVRRMPHTHGFFYHFVDMHTAERALSRKSLPSTPRCFYWEYSMPAHTSTLRISGRWRPRFGFGISGSSRKIRERPSRTPSIVQCFSALSLRLVGRIRGLLVGRVQLLLILLLLLLHAL